MSSLVSNCNSATIAFSPSQLIKQMIEPEVQELQAFVKPITYGRFEGLGFRAVCKLQWLSEWTLKALQLPATDERNKYIIEQHEEMKKIAMIFKDHLYAFPSDLKKLPATLPKILQDVLTPAPRRITVSYVKEQFALLGLISSATLTDIFGKTITIEDLMKAPEYHSSVGLRESGKFLGCLTCVKTLNGEVKKILISDKILESFTSLSQVFYSIFSSKGFRDTLESAEDIWLKPESIYKWDGVEDPAYNALPKNLWDAPEGIKRVKKSTATNQ